MFNDLKPNVFKPKSLSLRIDQFLKIHINPIVGSMNIIRSTLYALKDEIDIDNYVTDDNKKDKTIKELNISTNVMLMTVYYNMTMN